jgi:hypothetical protein
MSSLLVSHEFNQESVFCRETSGSKFRYREPSQTIVEQVQLDVLLVERKGLAAVSYCSAS